MIYDIFAHATPYTYLTYFLWWLSGFLALAYEQIKEGKVALGHIFAWTVWGIFGPFMVMLVLAINFKVYPSKIMKKVLWQRKKKGKRKE